MSHRTGHGRRGGQRPFKCGPRGGPFHRPGPDQEEFTEATGPGGASFQSGRPRRLYRSRRGVILGVCRGLAEYFNLSVFWVRVVAVAFLLFTGLWPIVGLYLLAGLLMKPAPAAPIRDESEWEFYESYTNSRSMALNRLKRTFDNLDRRLNRLEDVITAKEYDWDRRFHEI